MNPLQVLGLSMVLTAVLVVYALGRSQERHVRRLQRDGVEATAAR